MFRELLQTAMRQEQKDIFLAILSKGFQDKFIEEYKVDLLHTCAEIHNAAVRKCAETAEPHIETVAGQCVNAEVDKDSILKNLIP
jgi:hypothetical protein